MNDDTVREWADNLAKAAEIVLERFQSGYHPSDGQLQRLEGTLFPFVAQKLCGHRIVEECDCESEIHRRSRDKSSAGSGEDSNAPQD